MTLLTHYRSDAPLCPVQEDILPRAPDTHYVRVTPGQLGGDAYRKFYRAANASKFERGFEKTFGVSLGNAEREWRQQLLDREESFGPELRLRILQHRVRAAYVTLQPFLCLETYEQCLATLPDDASIRGYAVGAHILLGQYDAAARLLAATLASDEARLRPFRAAVACCLGQVYDVMGQRERAVAAYQQAIAAPDWWTPETGSTHAQVRAYLQRPVTERKLLDKLHQRRERALRGPL